MSTLRSVQSALVAKVPPPHMPLAAKGDWSKVEARLKLQLPSDYKWFIEQYGTGWFCKAVFITSPFWQDSQGNDALSIVNDQIRELYQSYVDSGDWPEWPYPYYPQNGGLLTFASSYNNEYLSWLTHGAPSKWTIVLFHHFELHDTGYSSIARLLLDSLEQHPRLRNPPLNFGYWMHQHPGFDPRSVEAANWPPP